MIHLMPVDSGMWNRLLGPSFILAPDLDTSQFTNEVGQFNQPLFLFGLWIVNGDHSCFALASRGPCGTPRPRVSERVARFMQDPTKSCRSDPGQAAPA